MDWPFRTFAVSIEGIDCAGKSTVAGQILQRVAVDLRLESVMLCEEFGSPVGAALGPSLAGFGPYSRVLAFAAEQYWYFERCVALAPSIVVWDRYIDSAIACREADVLTGGADPAVLPLVDAVNAHLPRPHLAVLLRIDPATAFDRAAARASEAGQPVDRSEVELAAQAAVFERILEEQPQRFAVVDGNANIDSVVTQAVGHVRASLDSASWWHVHLRKA